MIKFKDNGKIEEQFSALKIDLMIEWFSYYKSNINLYIAQSAGAAEYTDCTSADGVISPQRLSWYEIKKSDGEIPVMQEFGGMRNTPSFLLLPGPL